MNYIEELALSSKAAFNIIKNADTNTKNKALNRIADAII